LALHTPAAGDFPLSSRPPILGTFLGLALGDAFRAFPPEGLLVWAGIPPKQPKRPGCSTPNSFRMSGPRSERQQVSARCYLHQHEASPGRACNDAGRCSVGLCVCCCCAWFARGTCVATCTHDGRSPHSWARKRSVSGWQRVGGQCRRGEPTPRQGHQQCHGMHCFDPRAHTHTHGAFIRTYASHMNMLAL
jgi:hypothetical protein